MIKKTKIVIFRQTTDVMHCFQKKKRTEEVGERKRIKGSSLALCIEMQVDIHESNINSQKEELLALEAIYTNNFVNNEEFFEVSTLSLLLLLITSECQPRGCTETIPVTLRWSYPKNYPSELPPTFEIISEGIKETQLPDVCRELEKLWKEHQHEIIIFIWMDYLRHSLPAVTISVDYPNSRHQKPQISEKYQVSLINEKEARDSRNRTNRRET
jgi:hypothetical protein